MTSTSVLEGAPVVAGIGPYAFNDHAALSALSMSQTGICKSRIDAFITY